MSKRVVLLYPIRADIDALVFKLDLQILYAYHPNKRSATYKRAFDVGRKYAAESRNLLLRMSLLKNNVIIREV